MEIYHKYKYLSIQFHSSYIRHNIFDKQISQIIMKQAYVLSIMLPSNLINQKDTSVIIAIWQKIDWGVINRLLQIWELRNQYQFSIKSNYLCWNRTFLCVLGGKRWVRQKFKKVLGFISRNAWENWWISSHDEMLENDHLLKV